MNFIILFFSPFFFFFRRRRRGGRDGIVDIVLRAVPFIQHILCISAVFSFLVQESNSCIYLTLYSSSVLLLHIPSLFLVFKCMLLISSIVCFAVIDGRKWLWIDVFIWQQAVWRVSILFYFIKAIYTYFILYNWVGPFFFLSF